VVSSLKFVILYVYIIAENGGFFKVCGVFEGGFQLRKREMKIAAAQGL